MNGKTVEEDDDDGAVRVGVRIAQLSEDDDDW